MIWIFRRVKQIFSFAQLFSFVDGWGQTDFGAGYVKNNTDGLCATCDVQLIEAATGIDPFPGLTAVGQRRTPRDTHVELCACGGVNTMADVSPQNKDFKKDKNQ